MAEFDLEYLAGLPKPEILETIDYEALLSARKVDFLTRAPAYGLDFDVMDLETDPGVILLEESAAREVVLRARGNDIARDPYLYFSRGAAVDHLAAFYDVTPPRMSGESDDRLKERIILAIQGRSTGGTIPRYRSVAMGASIRVAEAHVYRDELTPLVNVAIFATDNNGVADQALLDTVAAALNAEAVRMVNDTIVVRPAVVSVVDVTARLTLLPSADASIVTSLQGTLAETWAAEGALGRDLTLDWIRARLMIPGVHSVAIDAPAADTVAKPNEAVRLGTVTLTIAGRAF